jgi:multidrug resistance efflux pump
MKSIRSRSNVHTAVQDVRRPLATGRRIYFLILGSLVFAVLSYVFGDLIVLRADGIVTSERNIIASYYPAKITEVYVREGERIKAGDPIASMESVEIMRSLAEIATRNADLTAKIAQLRARRASARALLPLAERSALETNDAVSRIDTIRHLVSAQRVEQALAARMDANSKLIDLGAQLNGLDEEIRLLEHSLSLSRATQEKFETSFSDGMIRASVDGIVGAKVPLKGQIVRAGDELTQVFHGNRYVIAYLSPWYLFSVRPGDRLRIAAGSQTAYGTVTELLSVTDAVPPEFQSMHRPRDRGRLIRISLAGSDDAIALSEKVSVTRCLIACRNGY